MSQCSPQCLALSPEVGILRFRSQLCQAGVDRVEMLGRARCHVEGVADSSISDHMALRRGCCTPIAASGKDSTDDYCRCECANSLHEGSLALSAIAHKGSN